MFLEAVKKMRRIGVFALLPALLLAYPVSAFSQQVTSPPAAAQSIQDAAIRKTSDRLWELQQKLYQQFGIEKIYIGGGSSLSLLQTVYEGKELRYRDLDILISLNQPVTEELAREIGLALESSQIGQFSEPNLRPRPRVNPELPGEARFQYNAGYGFFFERPGEADVDLTLFHSKKDMELNGVFSSDRIKVVLDRNTRLSDLVERQLRPMGYEGAVQAGLIEDTYKGYQDWRQRTPRIVSWEGFQQDPEQWAIRAVRTYAKNGLTEIPQADKQEITKRLSQQGKSNLFQNTRNLMKLLNDPAAADELKMLASIDAFKNWFPGLQRLLAERTREQIQAILQAPAKLPAGDANLGKFLNLLAEIPAKERIKILKPLMKIHPELELPKLLTYGNAGELRIGYFTGEFAPFHEGHHGVARQALAHGNLDLVFVIPTPHATNDPKTPKFQAQEWAERRAFVEKGTAASEAIFPWPPKETVESATRKPTIPRLVSGLESSLNSGRPITHIAGADSFHRIVGRDLLTTDPRPRLIVDRPGVALPEVSDPNVRVVPPEVSTPRSATMALHKIAAGETPDELSREVAEQVRNTPRYQEEIAELAAKADQLKRDLRSSRRSGKLPKSFFIDPRPGYSGLYESEAPRPTQAHRELLQLIAQRRTNEEIVYFLPKDTPEEIKSEWFRMTQKENVPVRFTDKYWEIPTERVIHVIDAESANALLKQKFLNSEAKNGASFLFYETAESPLSPLLRNSGAPALNIRRSFLPKSCNLMFSEIAPIPAPIY